MVRAESGANTCCAPTTFLEFPASTEVTSASLDWGQSADVNTAASDATHAACACNKRGMAFACARCALLMYVAIDAAGDDADCAQGCATDVKCCDKGATGCANGATCGAGGVVVSAAVHTCA